MLCLVNINFMTKLLVTESVQKSLERTFGKDGHTNIPVTPSEAFKERMGVCYIIDRHSIISSILSVMFEIILKICWHLLHLFQI